MPTSVIVNCWHQSTLLGPSAKVAPTPFTDTEAQHILTEIRNHVAIIDCIDRGEAAINQFAQIESGLNETALIHEEFTAEEAAQEVIALRAEEQEIEDEKNLVRTIKDEICGKLASLKQRTPHYKQLVTEETTAIKECLNRLMLRVIAQYANGANLVAESDIPSPAAATTEHSNSDDDDDDSDWVDVSDAEESEGPSENTESRNRNEKPQTFPVPPTILQDSAPVNTAARSRFTVAQTAHSKPQKVKLRFNVAHNAQSKPKKLDLTDERRLQLAEKALANAAKAQREVLLNEAWNHPQRVTDVQSRYSQRLYDACIQYNSKSSSAAAASMIMQESTQENFKSVFPRSTNQASTEQSVAPSLTSAAATTSTLRPQVSVTALSAEPTAAAASSSSSSRPIPSSSRRPLLVLSDGPNDTATIIDIDDEDNDNAPRTDNVPSRRRARSSGLSAELVRQLRSRR